MRKKLVAKLFSMVLLGSMLMTSGCATSDESSVNSNGHANRRDASQIVEDNQGSEDVSTDITYDETSDKRTEYPVTITTYGTDGQELETVYDEAPSRVLAVYQGCIETMLALGLEDHLIATAGLDNEVPDEYKSAFSSVDYLDEFTPSLETVTMLEPDMIFSWGSLFRDKTLGDTSTWIEKGTNTYMNSNTRPSNGNGNNNRTLENEYTDILNMGIIFDVQDRAEAIVNEMKDTIEEVKAKTANIEDKPTVLILESWNGAFTNYNSTSLGGDMVTQLGGVLANPDGDTLGPEDVIAANPDVIFVVYMPYEGDDPEQVKEDNLNVFDDDIYASLSAVQNQRVVPIMLSEMYASATRTQDGIITFANGLYPSIELE